MLHRITDFLILAGVSALFVTWAPFMSRPSPAWQETALVFASSWSVAEFELRTWAL